MVTIEENIEPDITIGFAVYRTWNNTWFRDNADVRYFGRVGDAKNAAQRDLTQMNRQVARHYDESVGYIYELWSGLGRKITKNDYAICKVQIVTEPVERMPWS